MRNRCTGLSEDLLYHNTAMSNLQIPVLQT